MRLFDGEKVGVYLDDFGPRLKKNKKGEEVHVVDLKLRVQPMTPELAGSVDAVVRKTLFKLSTAEQAPNLSSVGFALGVPRQQLHVHASSDTEQASIMLDQAEINNLKARVEKGVDGWAFLFRATIGPVSKTELEYVHAWYTQQRFLTFEESEPSLEFDVDPDEDEGTDDDIKAREVIDGRPKPMWDDEPAAEQAEPDHAAVNRPLHSHQSKKKDPKKAKAAKERAAKR